MDELRLEFQGTGDGRLVALLIAGVSAVLVVWGLVQLARSQRRRGLIALASAAGPIAGLLAVLVDAAIQRTAGHVRSARRSLAAAGAIAAIATAGLLWAILGDRPQSIWMAVLCTHLAVGIGVIYSSVFVGLGTARLSALAALRLAAIVVLMLLLFKPALLALAGVEDRRPALVVLVDRSGSMATADDPNLPDRYHQAVAALTAQAGRISADFRPMVFAFARDVQSLPDAEALTALDTTGDETDGTNIAAALSTAGRAGPRDNLAAVLLLTDGIDNEPGNPAQAAADLGVPVWPVAIGSSDKQQVGRPNVRLVGIDAPLEAVLNNVTPLTARVEITRLPNVNTEVRLYEGDSEQPLAVEQVFTTAAQATVDVEFSWTPRPAEGAGLVRRLRVEVAPTPLEYTDADNATETHVLLSNPRIRVLYVEGTIRPEYKFLRRMLETDPNVEFLGLVRIAENRFLAQGSIGGRRLDGLPKSDEDFALFDVILLGDLDRSFVTPAQSRRLRQFVSDGGGLMMIGGRNSFGPGGWAGSEVEAALPVEVGPKDARQVATEFVPRLTAAGEQHPIFAGITDYFSGPAGRTANPALPALPKLHGCVEIPRARPAAAVLAVHPGESNANGPLIVLATHTYGTGRAAAFTADTTWQWYLPMKPLGAESPYSRFWGQMVRWLARAESKSRSGASAVMLRTDRTFTRVGGKPIHLLGRVQDTEGAPARNARVVVNVIPVDGEGGRAISLPVGATDGVYTGEFAPEAPGTYRLTISAADATGTALGSDELTVTVVRESTELSDLARNDELLEQIAAVSGGVTDVYGLPDLLDRLARAQPKPADAPQAEVTPLYHFPVLFILFVALLTGEWLLRRVWQLQ